MNRKTFIAVSIVMILILLLGGLAYFYAQTRHGPPRRSFFSNLPFIGSRSPATEEAERRVAPVHIRERKNGKFSLVQVIDKEIIAPTVSPDGTFLWYVLRENGHVMSVDLNGQDEKSITNLTVLATFDARWSPKKDRLLMYYPENGAVKKFINGVATTSLSRFLPRDTISADWSPDGKSLAYLIKRSGDIALVLADVANKNPRVVYTTPVPDFTVRWITKNRLLLVSRPSGVAPSLVLVFSIAPGTAEAIMSGSQGVVIEPAPDGSSILVSTSDKNGYAETLSLYRFATAEATILTTLTLAEKCAFAADGRRVFCGTPQGTIPNPSPDAWYRGEVLFSDSIIEVDLTSGETTILRDDLPDLDLIGPFISPGGEFLFFQDKKTSTLWRLTLRDETPKE